MTLFLIVIAVGFGWGWGYWCHEARGKEWLLAALWPIFWPLGALVHWWNWGSKRRRLHRYGDMKWWQRGLRERRDSDPNKRWEKDSELA